MIRSSQDRGQPSLSGLARIEGAPAPNLALRVDEAAAAIHPLVLVRTVLLSLGGMAGMAVLSWPVCVAWMTGGLLIELWCWFATRSQALGIPIGWRVRRHFVANYLAMNAWWLLLGGLLWLSGAVAGQAGGIAIFFSIISLSILLFHNIPVAFLMAGSAPAAAALTVVLIADERGWRAVAPIWIYLGLGLVFIAGRALDSPSVQESNRRLKQSLDAVQILAENVTDVIVSLELSGVFRYVSPSAASVLGYAPSELIGTRYSDALDAEGARVALSALRRMMLDPSRSETVTSRFRRKDGRWLWLQTSAKLVCENGVPVGVIGVSRDVTEQLAADLLAREATQRAEAANKAKTEFLANVSHEIRTPMNAILGALQLLGRETISPEGRELIRQAGDCGWILSQLLNDILDFSKIEAGQLELSAEPMDIGEALEAVTAMLGAQARAKGLDLRCEIAGDALWIDADPVRVRQAFFNLLGNAVKFTEKGTVIARLSVRPLAAGRRHIRFEVEDTGVGIAPEAQTHLFERFRQAEGDNTRRFGGTGLGLSITRALAHLMGGQIGFSSVEGRGSTFWLEFEAPGADAIVIEPVEEAVLDNVRILLVEDNAANRLVARTMLSRLGATIDEAEDGVIGLEAARCGAYDLILMDIQMPHMDGITATRAIRGLRGAAGRVPILGLTANVMVHQKAEYLAAGMNGVVAKPISAGALLLEIARLMEAAEPNHERAVGADAS